LQKAPSSASSSSASPTATPAPSSSSTTPTSTPSPQRIDTRFFCPYEFERLCFFDREKTGALAFDLEFNTFLVGFVKNFLNTVDNAFDINEDEIVDARDFSIALYFVKTSQYPVLGITTSSTEPAVLGAQSDTLNFVEGTSADNQFLMEKLFLLIKIEIMIGVPLFLLFIILALISRRYAKK